MKQYKFNKNFHDFRKKIDLTENEKIELLKARKIIRASIRAAFNENQSKYVNDESIKILAKFTENSDKKIKPLFMTQGSFVYKTINSPANPPIQQMDLDDGVYIPLSFIEKESNGSFQKTAPIVRKVIHDCVRDLCQEKEWTLKNHPNCLRVTINDRAHIDLPIYSVPDNKVHTIKESLSLNIDNAIKFADLAEYFLSFDEATTILLATEDGWLKSDPREIQEWVRSIKNKYGDKFIFYSRYIKAWRDHQYPEDNSKFSSIMIMAAIAKAFSEYSYSKNENVALDLSMVARSLRLYIAGNGIPHPTEDKRLDENLPDRDSLIESLNSLSINLNEAVKTNKVDFLVEEFGSRFPTEIGVSTTVIASLIIPPTIAPAYSAPIKPAKGY